MGSEMVQTEVRLARRLQRTTGRPSIIPIRVAYTGPLEYELYTAIGHLQHVLWKESNDSARVLASLLDTTDNPKKSRSELPAARSRTRSSYIPLEKPGTCIYIPDRFKQEVLALAGEKGQTLVIYGPRQMGRSRLLQRYLAAASEAGKTIAEIDFQWLMQHDLKDLPSLLNAIARLLASDLGIDRDGHKKIESQVALARFLEKEIIAKKSSPLVLAFDSTELINSECQSDFYAMLRNWHNLRNHYSRGSTWEEVDIAVAMSPMALLYGVDPARSPLTVGTKVKLEPYTLAECHELNGCYSDLLDSVQVEDLWELLRGHPHLTHVAYLELKRKNAISFEALLRSAATEPGPFTDHLHSLLLILHDNPGLLDQMKQAIFKGTVLDDKTYLRLRSLGLVTRDRNRVNPPNTLYARYFRSTFKSAEKNYA